MFYEVYIDVFFAVNAMLDYVILLITQKLQHYKSTKIRIAAASMAGSAILSIYLCVPFRHFLWIRLLFYAAAYISMSVIAFSWNRKKGLLRSALSLYVVSLLVNGIFHWLSIRVEHSFELLVLCILIYWGIRAIYFLYAQKNEKEQHIYEIRIIYRKQSICLRGLWDTGNRLRSPYHGKGVSVIGYETISSYLSESVKKCMESGNVSLMEETEEEFIFLIPYETLDHKRGLMPVLTAEQMFVKKEGEELEYKNPLLGISRMPVSSDNAFQVVLTAQG